MLRSRPHFVAAAALGACLAFTQAGSAATVNFITLRDDGALAGTITDPNVTSERVMKVYAKTKLPRPLASKQYSDTPGDGCWL